MLALAQIDKGYSVSNRLSLRGASWRYVRVRRPVCSSVQVLMTVTEHRRMYHVFDDGGESDVAREEVGMWTYLLLIVRHDAASSLYPVRSDPQVVSPARIEKGHDVLNFLSLRERDVSVYVVSSIRGCRRS